MGSKTSAKAKIFLSINLVCSYILTAAAASDDACISPASAPITPPVDGEYGGSALQGHEPPEKCPMDALKLGVCANILGGLVRVVINPPPTTTIPCCSLLAGLVDLEVALCLCLAVKANVLGIVNLNIPLSLNLLLNACGRTPPTGFTCA